MRFEAHAIENIDDARHLAFQKTRNNEGMDMAKDKSGEAPDGFDVRISSQKGDGFAVKEEGAIISGRLIGRHAYKDLKGKPRAFYQVKLSSTCKASISDGNKFSDGTLEKDQIANIDESHAISQLASRCSDGGIYDVWIKYIEKKKVKGNNYWDMDVRLKIIKAPPKRVEVVVKKDEDDEEDNGGEEIPF